MTTPGSKTREPLTYGSDESEEHTTVPRSRGLFTNESSGTLLRGHMSSSFNAIERVDFSGSSRSPDMAPNYDGHGYYRRMLELQDKLRKSEEDRLRLEERFNQLLQESRNRHDACINRLRQRYIEFLEEQREKDERNHKLLGTLDRLDGSLALMTAKTGRLNVLRKQYEAYLLRRYASRPPSSVAGDNTFEVSQDGDRYGRRSNAGGYATPPPRQFQEFNRPSPYFGITPNERPVSSIGYHQTNVPQNQQVPRICVEPPMERQDNGQPLSQIPSQTKQRPFVGRSPRFPQEPVGHANFQTCPPLPRPETISNIPSHALESTVPREQPSNFRLDSSFPLKPNTHIDSNFIPAYAETQPGPAEQNAPIISGTRLANSGKAFFNSSVASNKMKSPATFSSTGPTLPLSGFRDASARFSALGFQNERIAPRDFHGDENELDRCIGKIKRLHGDLDPATRNAERGGELDHEQNTSDDLLNVTLSDDESDLAAEAKARHVKGVKDGRVNEDVAKVLALADDLASRKPETEGGNEKAETAGGMDVVPDTEEERNEEAVVECEGQLDVLDVGREFGSDGVAPLPELDDVDEERQGECASLNSNLNRESVEVPMPVLSSKDEECRDLPMLPVEREDEETRCLRTEEVCEPAENEEKQVVTSLGEEVAEAPLRKEEQQCEAVEEDNALTTKEPELKQEDYDVAQDLEPWNVEGLTKQIRELRLEDEDADIDEQEQTNVVTAQSNVQADEPTKSPPLENGKTDQPLNDDISKAENQPENFAASKEEISVPDQQLERTSTSHLTDEHETRDATFRQPAPETIEEEQKYERAEYGEHETENRVANYENQDQGQSQGLEDDGQEAQHVEQYEYEQTTGYENGADQAYQEYDGQNEQYGDYADGQYDEQYANDPNNQYDPNAQYEQSQEYGYEYNQQYGAGEGYENDPNQPYAYAENVPYDQGYVEQEEYQRDTLPDENVESGSVEPVKQESEEKSDIPANENPKSGAASETSQPKKKKDVIRSLLDSDTDSTIERNVSNTESDFDFN